MLTEPPRVGAVFKLNLSRATFVSAETVPICEPDKFKLRVAETLRLHVLLPSELCPTFVVNPEASLTHVSPLTFPIVKLKL